MQRLLKELVDWSKRSDRVLITIILSILKAQLQS